MAVVFGDIRDGEEVPVRLHREDVLNDVFGKGGSNLDAIMQRMGQEGRGILVYLREGSVGVRSDHRDARAREALQGEHEAHAEAVARRGRMAPDRPWRADFEGSRRFLHRASGLA
ncbi:hypothetical protein VXQ18_05860 [Brucella abortus]|nr:hypothetical protein [Brucella abortus]